MDINNTKAVQNDIHAVLSSSIGPLQRAILSSSPPRIQLPVQSSLHRSSRPSTASLVEERKNFLPAARSISTSSKGSVSKDSDRARPEHSRSSSRQSMVSSQGECDQMQSVTMPLNCSNLFLYNRFCYKL